MIMCPLESARSRAAFNASFNTVPISLPFLAEIVIVSPETEYEFANSSGEVSFDAVLSVAVKLAANVCVSAV